MRSKPAALLAVLILALAVAPATGQSAERSILPAMHWRMIGPFRGGRTVAVTGVAGDPSTYYIAAVNGGVWKSTDYGRVWKPIFDGQPTGSVGAIAVAPSDPRTLYVGSGEGLQRPDLSTGDGVYKSVDGGATWQHLGLRDGRQIAKIVIDPHDAQRLYVAVLGHPYGPNTERGVYRSTDGGATFTKVLYENADAGAIDLSMDPANPLHLYAAMWAARRAPWTHGGSYEKPGAGTGLFTTTDGGTTWQPLTHGLPTQAQGLGRIGLTISPADPQRMYAMVDSPSLGGVYRSDDAGQTWRRTNTEERVWGRGDDFAAVTADPKNRDLIYVANTSTYRSTDGGTSFTAIKGAPGGDDYHTVWVNPENPDIILLGCDQGATLSVNGGRTWSSWYNQPTAQFYHVSTDNRFPYWVYGAQQESGSAAVASRGNDGAITFREFHPVGAEEYGYVAPDPLHPSIVYGGKVTRFDWTTMQTQNVSPVVLRDGTYRFNRTAPLVFSAADPHALYFGSNVIFVTRNGGGAWKIISPDLTRANPGIPANFAAFATADPQAGKHRGVVYSLAPSPRVAGVVWAGTDDGLVWRTADGGAHWVNVTPPDLRAWNKVAQIDASHTDTRSAYIAVNKLRLDDLRPYIYRTHDNGKTWTKIVNGLPDDAPVNTVREDPSRPGLLFAGTEHSVYVSLDDGSHWQSLQNDLPTTSVRDLVIHGDDVVVGTHGRSFWILDDITPLRQLRATTAATTTLFAPAAAYRIERNVNNDTPLPPEEPVGENPPDGAILDYVLPVATNGSVRIEIRDARGALVRQYASTDAADPIDPELDVPTYWVRPFHALAASAGFHRFVWDLHATAPRTTHHEYPSAATYGDTPRVPQGPTVVPGTYEVRLTAGDVTRTQRLVVKPDPRVRATQADLQAQYALASALAWDMSGSYDALSMARGVLRQIDGALERKPAPALAASLTQTKAALEALLDADRPTSLAHLHGNLSRIYALITTADAAPTTQQYVAAHMTATAYAVAVARWHAVRDRLPQLNAQLRAANLTTIDLREISPPQEEVDVDEP